MWVLFTIFIIQKFGCTFETNSTLAVTADFRLQNKPMPLDFEKA
jgi:hypothetical protein